MHTTELTVTTHTLVVLTLALAAVAVLGRSGPAEALAGAVTSLEDAPVAPSAAFDVRLSTDGPTVDEMVEAVREQARQTPGAVPDAPVTLVLTCDLARETGDDRSFVAGQQRGSLAFARVDLGWPEATVLHEIAHVLAPGDGHGDVWRSVYLGAVAELYGEDRAAREHRRVAWVHDRCYVTDDCPVLSRSTP